MIPLHHCACCGQECSPSLLRFQQLLHSQIKYMAWPAQNCIFSLPVACVHTPSCQKQDWVLHVALACHGNPRTFCIRKARPGRESVKWKTQLQVVVGWPWLAGKPLLCRGLLTSPSRMGESIGKAKARKLMHRDKDSSLSKGKKKKKKPQ